MSTISPDRRSRQSGAIMALEKEIETYNRKLPELLPDKGKFVVIHGEEIAGLFPSLEEALREGYSRYGNEPFLAREISDKEKTLVNSRMIRPCQSSQDQ